MELTNEFRMGVPIERAWEVLTDLERIAPCMPGAQLQEVEGDEHRGVVKVKVGPITAQYKGVARFVEQEAPHRAVLRAEGRETRGQGNASATITATLEPDLDGTRVALATDLTITGKVAQFGRGVLADVSAKLIDQFVESLEATVLAADGETDADGGADGPVATEPIDGEAVEVPDDAAAVAPAPATPGTSATSATPGAAARQIDGPAAEPVSIVSVGAGPVAKRVAPAAAALAVLWLVGVLLRRRKR